MLNETLSVKINKTQNSKIESVDWENLPFGKVFSDHMLVMNYKDGAWMSPEIKPFADLSMHPATSAIHYGQSVFEGMKANRSEDGSVLLFRPDMNAKRFVESCERMCMPTIDEDVFTELVKRLVDVDRDWIPEKDGYSLYIRPFMFATDDFIGIKPSDTYTFMIFTCPVGVYYSNPVNVKIEEFYTRASQGGVGRAKTAGNYGASLYPAKKGNEEGFHQLIWTDGVEHKYIEESGTMNIMFVVDGKLITPSEDSDTILKGVTKRSVVEITQHWGLDVEERKITVEEIVTALKEGRVSEAFGAGTAATIAPIAKIGFRGDVYELPAVETREVSNRVSEYLTNLKLGKAEDEMNWLVTF
ncbi:MAG: branched-chain amino acid aminotransferase [Crocinitomicaceae bacterium]|nr:branched-chain amino acid aminotransferase [Crocinitomicaceae bacterium]MDG1777373.1 branched-chain amino acid aminotransferase [Crocinitomicaceae bacterium]